MSKQAYLEIGVITKTFGIKGELKVYPTSDTIMERLISKCPFYLGERKEKIDITNFRFHNKEVLININNLDNINQVLGFIKQKIYIKKDEVEALSDDEFYFDDLIDLEVYNQHGEHLGKVTEVLDMPASAVLIIYSEQGQKILVPFVASFILKVDDEKIIIQEIEGLR